MYKRCHVTFNNFVSKVYFNSFKSLYLLFWRNMFASITKELGRGNGCHAQHSTCTSWNRYKDELKHAWKETDNEFIMWLLGAVVPPANRLLLTWWVYTYASKEQWRIQSIYLKRVYLPGFLDCSAMRNSGQKTLRTRQLLCFKCCL